MSRIDKCKVTFLSEQSLRPAVLAHSVSATNVVAILLIFFYIEPMDGIELLSRQLSATPSLTLCSYVDCSKDLFACGHGRTKFGVTKLLLFYFDQVFSHCDA